MNSDYTFGTQQVTCPGGTLYSIRVGDTLYKLSQRFRISVDAIIKANPGIDPQRLQIGQQICIPGEPSTVGCPPGSTLYIIQAGDTLYKLSQRFGVAVDAIIRANPGIDPQRLQIGQRICIPTAMVPPTLPRTCALILNPRSNGPFPDSGGVFWMRRKNGQIEGLVAAVNLPSPQSIGANRYMASLTWARTSYDVPLHVVPGEPGTWVVSFSGSFPAEFFALGSVDILLDGRPVMGGVIEECR